MSNDLQTVIDFFKSDQLNDVGAKLIDLYRRYTGDMKEAELKLRSAIERRWMAGKFISEYHDKIIEECGTQRAFGEKLGLSEGTISNDKRAYETLKEEGVLELDQLIPFLKSRELSSNVYTWERIGTLLNAPDSLKKNQRPKDEKRLEDLYSEIEDIKVRNEGANPSVAERAGDTLKYLKDVEEHIGIQDIFRSTWRSREYMDFVKSIGWDYITGEQAEYLDPHHTLIDGSSRGPGGKVADVFTIPVNRATHNAIEEDRIKPTKLEIAEALVRTMALFITTNMEGDNE